MKHYSKLFCAAFAATFSFWLAYESFLSFSSAKRESEILLYENVLAMSESGNKKKSPVYCKTKEFISSDGSNGPVFGGPLGLNKCYICADGHAEFSEEGRETCGRLQRPICSSSEPKNASQSTDSHAGYCIPKN